MSRERKEKKTLLESQFAKEEGKKLTSQFELFTFSSKTTRQENRKTELEQE